MHIYKDHRNLLTSLLFLRCVPTPPGMYSLECTGRQFTYRAEFNIEDIEPKNVFADILTKWSPGHQSRNAVCENIAVHYQSVLPSSKSIGEVTMKDIKLMQENQTSPQAAMRVANKIWEKAVRFEFRMGRMNLK